MARSKPTKQRALVTDASGNVYVPLNVRVPEKLYDDLHLHAKKNHKTIQATVAEAFEVYLDVAADCEAEAVEAGLQ